LKPKPLLVTFKIRLKTILFPITFIELTTILEKNGWEISANLPFPRPVTRLSGVGEIARKGKTVLSLDSSAQVLAITDVTIKSALDCFDELTKALIEDFGVDLNGFSKYYGFNATYEIPTKNKAYETIAKNLKIPMLDEFEKIFSEKLWPYELRFAGADLQANSDNWFDITLRPNYERDDSYIVSVIYRNDTKEKAVEFSTSFEQRIEQLVKLIDR